MKSQTRALSFTALSTAGAVVVLYLGSFLPTMRLAMVALAALFTAVCVIEGGLRYGTLCFAAVSILGFFIVPDRVLALIYVTCFGAYPLVKSIAERQKSVILSWIIKLAIFFVVLALYTTILSELILGAIIPDGWGLPIIAAVGLVAFVVYDIGMSKLIGFYLVRIYKYRESR